MKMKSRRRKGYAKNKRKRQLGNPKNLSSRFATTVTDFGSIFEPFWEHFGTQYGYKIAPKFRSKIDTPKIDQRGT